MDVFRSAFCLYDDPELPEGWDADRWSPLLRDAHRRLWSKRLPSGGRLELSADLTVTAPGSIRGLRLSSDTIATTHERYPAVQTHGLWRALDPASRKRYDRGFYTLGGFMVFPCHQQSLNQRRGTCSQVSDRFDLTLECIRLFYAGVTGADRNPLGGVLLADAPFFDLFRSGTDAFESYVQFFYLQDLVADGRIRWFDNAQVDEWQFDDTPLPQDQGTYVNYLENVLAFVTRRGNRLELAGHGRGELPSSS